MKRKTTVLGLFAVLMILSMIAAPVMAQQPSTDPARLDSPAAFSRVEADTEGVYIVKFTDPAVASYTGGIAGLAATSPQATGAARLDPRSPAAVAYRQYLNGKHAEMLTAMESALGHSVKVTFRYLNAFNGMAVRMTPAEAAVVNGLPGVASVEREVQYTLTTDVGPSWIGAPGIWDGNTTSGTGTMGEGVIVGILDTGINSTHPSFADVGDDGYDHTNPYGAGNYTGVCDPGGPDYDPTFVCNDKLIGAWDMVQDPTGDPNAPEDSDGHGSHTASTVAGNVVNAYLAGPTLSVTSTISGVAPHANIIAYDVCVVTCPGSATLAAVDQAITDTVDVINFSISGSDQPWSDSTELAFLDAFNAGIFVSASAGNNGPGASTVAHTSPWVMTTAAGTHNRLYTKTLFGLTGGTNPPADMIGAGFTSAYGPANIVHASDYGDGQCLNPFPANTWTNGEIVICDRGTIARVQKGANVLAGGAAGFILANVDSQGESINGDAHFLPAIHVGDANGDLLRAWTQGQGIGPSGSIAATDFAASLNNAYADHTAGFSSRGPSQYDLLAPNVIAPGVDILAAYCKGCTGSDPDFEYLSGTSMSSPHDAGAAALMTALNPTWTPDMIMSAMMSTAFNGDSLTKEDGVTPADPFDVGAGRLDMAAASNAGFVLMESGADFLAADPNNSGDPRTLNVPNMVDQACINGCVFTRTLKSVYPDDVYYDTWVDDPPGVTTTVSPSNFNLAPGGTQQVVITVDTSSAVPGSWFFGNVYFEPVKHMGFLPPAYNDTSGPEPSGTPMSVNFGPPTQHFPLVVKVPPADIDVTPTSLTGSMVTNDTMTDTLTIANLGAAPLTWSIVEDEGAATRQVDWFDNFDSYGTGVSLHGLGGWKGWGNDSQWEAFTSSAQALSSPNSVDINGNADLVREFSGYTTGTWIFTANMYIPSGFSGETFFILLNSYDDAGSNLNWSTQVSFSSSSGQVSNDGASGGSLPYVTDQWVELRIEIDLDNNFQYFFYDGQLLYAGTWTEEVSGGGAANIGAIDLFANGASTVYYDDLSLVASPISCSAADDIPWLSLSPTGGTTAAGDSDDVTVTYDSTGLSVGTYTGLLCISSNDPDESLVPVPVELDIVGAAPEIEVDPTFLISTQGANTTVTQTLTISNTGTATLNWDIDEDNSPGSTPVVTVIGPVEGLLSSLAAPAGEAVLPDSPSATLWDQTANPGGNCAPSQNFLDFGPNVAQAADDFFVSDAAGWTITSVFVDGVYSGGGGPSPDWDVIIYADNSGAPGAPVYTGTALPVISDVSGDVTIDLSGNPAYLPQGTYWVSAYANMAFGTNGQFFWCENSIQNNVAVYHWQDPADLFGTGCTSWNTAATCGVGGGGASPDLQFTLFGEIGSLAEACDAPEDIPWLSLDMTAEVADPAVAVTLTFDSTGLSTGTYDAALCVNSNDPDPGPGNGTDLVIVDVSLTVSP